MDLKVFIEKFGEAIEIENVSLLTGNTEFRKLEEWSSLSIMLLIAMFDEEFEKQIGDKELKSCQTINDLFNLANTL